MFGLVTLVQPEVDGPELLLRLFLNSGTRSTSKSLGTELTVGPPLPDPYSSNDFDRLVPSGLEDGGPGAALAVGPPLPSHFDTSYYDTSYLDASYYDDNEYYPHFGFDSGVEW